MVTRSPLITRKSIAASSARPRKSRTRRVKNSPQRKKRRAREPSEKEERGEEEGTRSFSPAREKTGAEETIAGKHAVLSGTAPGIIHYPLSLPLRPPAPPALAPSPQPESSLGNARPPPPPPPPFPHFLAAAKLFAPLTFPPGRNSRLACLLPALLQHHTDIGYGLPHVGCRGPGVIAEKLNG